MDKRYVLSEIIRTAVVNGEVPLGRQRFLQETGIKSSDWGGALRARWGDALREAGFAPNQMQNAYDETLLIEKYIALARELGHFPTVDELRLKARRGPNISAAPPSSGLEREESFGSFYLIKSGRYYKIGCTNSVGRREYELAVQLPERASLIHAIRTDDPTGIEAYWHRRFAPKRKGGE